MKRIVIFIVVMMLLLCACGNSSDDTNYVDTHSTSLLEIYDMYSTDEKEEFLRELLADKYGVSENTFLHIWEGELEVQTIESVARDILETVSYDLDEINYKYNVEDGTYLISNYIEGAGSKEDLIEGLDVVYGYWYWVNEYKHQLRREGLEALGWSEDASQ